jgi:hypothetical protein
LGILKIASMAPSRATSSESFEKLSDAENSGRDLAGHPQTGHWSTGKCWPTDGVRDSVVLPCLLPVWQAGFASQASRAKLQQRWMVKKAVEDGYGLEPYRYKGQRYTTVILNSGVNFLQFD